MTFSWSKIIATLALVCSAPLTLWAQPAPSGHAPVLHGFFAVAPWTEGSHTKALNQSAALATIPMSSYSITASKDGNSYSGTIVGGSPWASTLVTTQLNAVVVPLNISIGTSTFNPSTSDSCDSTSTVSSFDLSPLVVATGISFNGVTLTAQYIDGFRQAEFATLVASSGYSNPISYTIASPYVVSSSVVGRNGTTYSSGCSLLGILSYSWLNSYLTKTVMPSLKNSGVISPTSFVIFLMKNVVESTSTRPSVRNCCILGYHGATGSPVQTYSPVDWDTTGLFGANVHDAAIAAHEIGEWMDDPLGMNPTPAWGGVGQVSSCQTNLEVGDPLSGTDMPLINGYHLQELAFFSWYYNSPTDAAGSLGTADEFSSNGTFSGPSKACPPGGTY
jgi:hypothetical protein